MAIEKMHFINIVGPIKKLDEFVMDGILPFHVELVQAMSVLDGDKKGVYPFIEPNPYEGLMKKVKALEERTKPFSLLDMETVRQKTMAVEEMEEKVDQFIHELAKWYQEKVETDALLERKQAISAQLGPISDLDVDIQRFFHLDYVKFRFGSIPLYNLDKLGQYEQTLNILTQTVFETDELAYIMYFALPDETDKVDELLASLYFQRVYIAGEVNGRPGVALQNLDEEILRLKKRQLELETSEKDYIEANFTAMGEIASIVNYRYQLFNVRKYAAHTKEAYHLCGWISDSDLAGFQKAVDKFDDTTSIVYEPEEVDERIKTPTKLKNRGVVKAFESLVGMYGVPSYNELDPTPLVTVTYLLIFGMMFGDVGQGLIIFLGAFLLYKLKGIKLAKVISYCGISSVIFGFVYGSFFGNETIIHSLLPFLPLLEPMKDQLITLGIGLGLGAILIVVAIVMNIINQVKRKEYGKALFDKNGVAGLVFYLSVILFAFGVYAGQIILSSAGFLVLFVILPLLLIFFGEPLERWMKTKKFKSRQGYYVEAVFEIIETLLSFFSNTVSFIRVGAFALNHVALFMAFQVMQRMLGGVGGVAVMIFGNILIIGLEGLIVFIQGLRIQYYEMFSRFLEADGKAFEPYEIHRKLN